MNDAPATGTVVEFTSPHEVRLVDEPLPAIASHQVRVRTWYSGISAGTELTAYRGTNPYLTRTWDSQRRLFVDGQPTFSYPVSGWGYSEVGEVVEIGSDVTTLAVGDVVHGIWGHRSHATLDETALAWRHFPDGLSPVAGTFARVASIALNAVLAADLRLGDRVAIFGQGVIGLLATRLAVLSGAQVIAIDSVEQRLDLARSFGADHVLSPTDSAGSGAAVRRLVPEGVDAAIELSGRDDALHEAIRSVRIEGVVAASGFYQGGAGSLRLGEEFHHNRVRIVASQISGVPVDLGFRWNQRRLVETVINLMAGGSLDIKSLVTDIVPIADVADVFRRLDAADPDIVQAVLAFPDAPPAYFTPGAGE